MADAPRIITNAEFAEWEIMLSSAFSQQFILSA